jgi:membrane-associated phospholipid phosphatase
VNAGLRIAGTDRVLVTLGRLPDSVFNRQLKLVQSYAALRAERTAEILAQVVPQAAHWSSIAALSQEHHRYTWELIGFGLRFAMMMVMRLKYEFNVQRPCERSPVVQPVILTPGYTAYPSGHATEASFVAELLPLLAGDPTHPCADKPLDRQDGMARQLNRLAFRIAQNRVVAGLHYPVDSIAGHVLGAMLARYVVWLADGQFPGALKKTPVIGAQAFRDPGQVLGDDEEPDFDCFVDEPGQRHVTPPDTAFPKKLPDAPVLRDLWTLARREWVGE